MSTILTPADLASELGSDARTVRKFLRSITDKENQPGKGSRWTIEKKQLRSLRSQFTKWTAAQDEKRAAKETEVATDETEDSTDE